MKNHRYILEPYKGMKSRYRCPSCNKTKVFTKYIDTTTNEHLSDTVGYCSRLIKCGYHYKPKQYFQDNNISLDKTKISNYIKPKAQQKPKTSFIDAEVMKKSKTSKKENYFIDFLASLWDYEIAYYLAEKYNIGTSKYWNGATVFWQVDKSNNIRTGKIMLYNASNGKRIKEPYNHINWVHKALKIKDFNLEQCYFGEHLLNEDINIPVAICESEKTAIISSILLPEFVWLACGGLNNLNDKNTRILKGRYVVLFPDTKCFDLWNDKIPKLTKLATFKTSTLLKDKATENEKIKGFDIADYLIREIQ